MARDLRFIIASIKASSDLERVGDGWPKTWRMRRDTQNEGSQYSGSNSRFLTMDQHAWEETQTWALAVLQDHGIDLRSNSPWRGREIELADILAKVDPHDTP